MSHELRTFVLLAALVALPCSIADAQTSATQRSATAPGEIRGRLVDSVDRHAIGAGTVTVVRAADAKLAGSALPDADGAFRIDGLVPGRYTVRVRSLGYAPLSRANVAVPATPAIVDLGALALSRVAAQLGPQAVTAEREDVVIAPDRNIYSTKNMVTAGGGTAIDVLRNVPTVEVDATNNVSLRGSQNVVVQINGRTSPLKGDQLGNFLAQLPASTIKNVEVSTNPSAKNDPEGTAGIINIVLNQEAELGWSGGINGNAGSTGQINGSGNVGRQQGPLTWFLSYGLFTGHQTVGGYSEQTNLAIPVPAYVDAHIAGHNQPLWQNATWRSEYKLAPHDAVSADMMVSGGHFTNENASSFEALDASRAMIGAFDQFTNRDQHNTFADFDFAYRRTGDAKARTFSTEVDVNNNNNSNGTYLFGDVRQGNASTGAVVIPNEHDVASGAFPQWTLQSDYTQPFGAGSKLETGFKEIVRHTKSNFAAAYLDSASGEYLLVPARTTVFDYQEQIGAGYGVLSERLGKVQAQGGLRLEAAATQLALPTAAPDSQRFDNRYASAFPSGILSYNFTPMRQLKLSYSRRISRPWPGQLSPVEIRQDARTVFHGNPALRPEYTDAVELALQDTHGWGTLQLNPYVRHTAHAVRFIQTTDTTGITTGTFENVASTLQVGADVNVTYRSGPFTLFGGANAYRYSSDATNLAGDLSTRALVWSARANGTWRVSKQVDAQLFANYRAPMATEGGRQRAFMMLNLALRRKLWNDKGNVTLRVMDPFSQFQFGSVTTNPRVIQSTVRHFTMRGIYIGFSRNFGQELKLRPKQIDDQQQQVAPAGVP